MLINDIFAKSIDRDIKGVIKVGQEDGENAKQELEEYVVTKELQKHFATFFANYKKGITGETDKMGVWVSGFFGSGKSHFLKILGHILANRDIEGKRAIDYFVGDGRIKDQLVIADMQLALTVPTDVMLFNIDSKAITNNGEKKDTILTVFLKVFNEMQGFSGARPYIADMERKLSQNGKYEEFKEKFYEISGKKWEEGRNEFSFNQDSVVKTLTETGQMSEAAAWNLCNEALSPYDFSIEDFAKLVKQYLDTKGPKSHIIFLVDEIGQYIGDNDDLMLNVQTITEDLGRICRGRAWIVVTSQQNISDIVKVNDDTFSKIQGRFDTRLSLSSANVDEVIRKRILEKTTSAKKELSALYDEKATVIKNLLSFNDEVEKKLYANVNDFVEVYPFVPYQFDLLGKVLFSIRKYSASGKHLSDGERSMLALFKESAEKVKERETGLLIPFCMFYDPLEQFLDHKHSNVISRALRNDRINPRQEEQCFNVDVLKALFLIKYINEIKPTLENITTLMIDEIDADRIAVRNKTIEALNVLESQALIQRNGENYIFLSDEEQEINKEISAINIETGEIAARIQELIFDYIYPTKSYRYKKLNGKYVFTFSQYVDGRPCRNNQNFEIGMEILTPLYDGVRSPEVLRLRRPEFVTVVMPTEKEKSEYIEDIRVGKQINKYKTIKQSGAMSSQFTDILAARIRESQDRDMRAKLLIAEALMDAVIYVNGDELNSSGRDIDTKFNDAFDLLVSGIYTKLYYIDVTKNHDDIIALLNDKNFYVIDPDEGHVCNGLALKDMREYLRGQSSMHIKTTRKTLYDKFKSAPYGFIEEDIAWLAAALFKDGTITLTLNDEPLNLQNTKTAAVADYLLKRDFAERLIIEKRERASETQIKTVVKTARELFSSTLQTDDEDTITTAVQDMARRLRDELRDELNEQKLEARLPGVNVVNEGFDLMTELIGARTPLELFSIICAKQDKLLNFAEDYEPVKEFYKGGQLEIFKKAIRAQNRYNECKLAINNENMRAISEEIEAVISMEQPYSQIAGLRDKTAQFSAIYSELLEEKRGKIIEDINAAKAKLLETIKIYSISEKIKKETESSFLQFRNSVRNETKINQLSYLMNCAAAKEKSIHEAILEELNTRANDSPKEDEGRVGSGAGHKKMKAANLCHIQSWHIENVAEADRCLSALRSAIIEQIKDGSTLDLEL